MKRLFETHHIRTVTELDGMWDFKMNGFDKAYKLPVPSVWEQHPDFLSHRGKGTYTRKVYVKYDGNVRLEFKGVSHTADVYFDGEKACHHYNAFTPFSMIINNYGPNKNYASVHLELPDTMTVDEVDLLIRREQLKVFKETGVILTGIGVYSYNTKNDEAAKIRNALQEKVMSHDWALQVHGFYADTENKTIRFDVVTSFDITGRESVEILTKEIGEMYPDYELQIAHDVDISD